MPSTYRLVDPKGELLSDADTIGCLKGILSHLDPGRYTIDELCQGDGARPAAEATERPPRTSGLVGCFGHSARTTMRPMPGSRDQAIPVLRSVSEKVR